MQKSLLLTGLSILLITLPSKTPSLKSGGWHLASGSYQVDVLIEQSANTATERYEWWGGRAPGSKEPVLYKILARKGKVRLFVPASAWGGIATVDECSLTTSKDGAVLRLTGGQGESAYRAELRFRGEHLISKIVRNREFPEESYEKTEFHYVPENR